MKLKHQNLAATKEAKPVAIEVLSRARVRPNFVSTATATKQSAPDSGKHEPPIDQSTDERDPGVTDEIWNQLQANKQAALDAQKLAEQILQNQEQDLALAKTLEAERTAEVSRLAQQKAKDDAEMNELKRLREEARLREQMAQRAREKAAAESERFRKDRQENREQEAKAQQKLREMGVCPGGFRWIKMSGGYRCAGGVIGLGMRKWGFEKGFRGR